MIKLDYTHGFPFSPDSEGLVGLLRLARHFGLNASSRIINRHRHYLEWKDSSGTYFYLLRLKDEGMEYGEKIKEDDLLILRKFSVQVL